MFAVITRVPSAVLAWCESHVYGRVPCHFNVPGVVPDALVGRPPVESSPMDVACYG